LPIAALKNTFSASKGLGLLKGDERLFQIVDRTPAECSINAAAR
jgi:hypothetical protein